MRYLDCIDRESNPGYNLRRVAFYPWTIEALSFCCPCVYLCVRESTRKTLGGTACGSAFLRDLGPAHFLLTTRNFCDYGSFLELDVRRNLQKHLSMTQTECYYGAMESDLDFKPKEVMKSSQIRGLGRHMVGH